MRPSVVDAAEDRHLSETLGLVDDLAATVLQRWKVLAAVVGAEEQLSTGGQHGPEVGPRTAPVTAVSRGQTRHHGCVHFFASSARSRSWTHRILTDWEDQAVDGSNSQARQNLPCAQIRVVDRPVVSSVARKGVG
jgi:hypothetical protein